MPPASHEPPASSPGLPRRRRILVSTHREDTRGLPRDAVLFLWDMQSARLRGAWRAARQSAQDQLASSARGALPGGLAHAVAVEPVYDFGAELGRREAGEVLIVQKGRWGGETDAYKVCGRPPLAPRAWLCVCVCARVRMCVCVCLLCVCVCDLCGCVCAYNREGTSPRRPNSLAAGGGRGRGGGPLPPSM